MAVVLAMSNLQPLDYLTQLSTMARDLLNHMVLPSIPMAMPPAMLAAPSMDILISMAKGQLTLNLMVLPSIHMAMLPAMLDEPSMDTQDMARDLLNHMVLVLLSTLALPPASMVQPPMASPTMAREMLRLKPVQMQRLTLMLSMATMAMLLQLPMEVMAMDGQAATPQSLASTAMATHTPTGVKMEAPDNNCDRLYVEL